MRTYAYRGRIIYTLPPPEVKAQFEEVQRMLGVKALSDWYRVDQKAVQRVSESSPFQEVMRVYKKSLSNAVTQMYPNDPVEAWRLPSDGKPDVPRGLLEDFALRTKFFEWLGDRLNIKSPEDWYSKGAEEVSRAGGKRLLFHYSDSVARMAMDLVRDYPWQPWRFRTPPSVRFTIVSALR